MSSAASFCTSGLPRTRHCMIIEVEQMVATSIFNKTELIFRERCVLYILKILLKLFEDPNRTSTLIMASRKEILGKVYKIVPPMLETFHKGAE